jgi:TetR/AcrR family transcriptional regulator
MATESSTTPQGDERRLAILNAAIDVFGEAGYAGARIDEVARRVGIRRPSVLYHFPDKPALYGAAMGAVVRDVVGRILATEECPGERLEAIADAWVDFVIERPNAARILLRQMIDVDPQPLDETGEPVQRLLASIQDAIDERAGSEAKALNAAEFSLILSSTSLVWVASGSAVEGTLGLDTLTPSAIQRHRMTLHALIRQLVAAASEATTPPQARVRAQPRRRRDSQSGAIVR